jgi:hypothetical protein
MVDDHHEDRGGAEQVQIAVALSHVRFGFNENRRG